MFAHKRVYLKHESIYTLRHVLILCLRHTQTHTCKHTESWYYTYNIQEMLVVYRIHESAQIEPEVVAPFCDKKANRARSFVLSSCCYCIN